MSGVVAKDVNQNYYFWQAVMSLQNDVMVEHSSVESMNSLQTQSGLSGASPLTLNPGATPVSRPESTSAQQNHKKVKNRPLIWKVNSLPSQYGVAIF